MTTYTVQAGNTLSGIARKFGVPVSSLMAANQIADPNRVKVGQVLTIPELTTDQSALTPAAPPKPPAAPAASALAINRSKCALAAGQYMAEAFPKDLVVLHFTAGQSARSAYNSWCSTAERVATAYIVDADGTIYETFDPRYWAYHLGVAGAASANWKHDKRSIAIEIANVGALQPDPAKPDQLNWWPNNFGTKWCLKSDAGKYVAAPYRGFQYFAAYPEPQVVSVVQLVADLCQRFSIPKVLPPPARRDAFDMAFYGSFQGIASHQNFRKDKTDVGPAFPWDRL